MAPELIKARIERLKTDRTTAEERWAAIEQYIAPYRGEFFRTVNSEASVNLDKGEVYDGTALQSAQSLAANLHGNLTSPYVQWFGLSFRNAALADDPDAREWLEACAEAVWKTLQESNWSLEVAENYLDLTTFGTTFMFEEAADALEWEGALFSALPLKECYFEENSRGKIHVFYRVMQLTALQLVDKFGEKDVPDDLVEISKGPAASATKHEVVFCIWPRKLGAKQRIQGKKQAPKTRAYGAKYILSRDCIQLGKETGYYEMPVFATRWAKVSESQWGHGPSHLAIYDVQALNRQEMLTLMALEKVVDPPQKTTERGVIGDLDLRPAGLTVVRSMDDLAPMTFGTEWNVLNVERQNRRNMIREYYLVSKLDLKESPAMTATEVERRWQQMQKLLGPTLGRLQSDLLSNVVEMTFSLMLRAGKLPEVPAALVEVDAEMDIEYTGPLPIAQKADTAAAIERELGLASNLAQTYGPEVLDAIDATKALREHAKLTAVPAKVLRSDAEIKQKRKEREEQQKQAQAMAQAEQMAGVAKNLGSGMKDMAQAGGDAGQMMGGTGDTAETVQ